MRRVSLVLGFVMLVAASGCGEAEVEFKPPAGKGGNPMGGGNMTGGMSAMASDPMVSFNYADNNKDKVISGSEMNEMFTPADTDSDGKVTPDEWKVFKESGGMEKSVDSAKPKDGKDGGAPPAGGATDGKAGAASAPAGDATKTDGK